MAVPGAIAALESIPARSGRVGSLPARQSILAHPRAISQPFLVYYRSVVYQGGRKSGCFAGKRGYSDSVWGVLAAFPTVFIGNRGFCGGFWGVLVARPLETVIAMAESKQRHLEGTLKRYNALKRRAMKAGIEPPKE